MIYKLNLSAHIKITRVRYIFILKLAHLDTSLKKNIPGVNLNS